MALFPRMRRRLSLRGLFRVCAAAFVVRSLLFWLATSPVLLYVSAVLQIFEFGIFLPTTVYYVAEYLDAANQAKGQGLIHVFSNGIGPAAATAVSGWLIDRLGVNAMLAFTTISGAVGFLVVVAATSRYFDKRSKKK